MPTASVRIATVANPGFRASVRSAKREVAPAIVQEPGAARVANVVLHAFDAADRQRALPACLACAESAPLELLRLHGRVKLQLFGELALVAAPEDDRPHPLDDIGYDTHARPPPPSAANRAVMTQFTAADARSQDACSSPSCLRPAVVSS